jgi:hypothetical protein
MVTFEDDAIMKKETIDTWEQAQLVYLGLPFVKKMNVLQGLLAVGVQFVDDAKEQGKEKEFYRLLAEQLPEVQLCKYPNFCLTATDGEYWHLKLYT